MSDRHAATFGSPVGPELAKTNDGGVYMMGQDKAIKVSTVNTMGAQATELSILQTPPSHGILTAERVMASMGRNGGIHTAIQMQRMSGTLADFLRVTIAKHGWRSRSQFFRTMSDLLMGAARLEENGVKHRDHKSSNVLMDDRGRVYVCDFGLAVWWQADHVLSSAYVVTLWYRAPEICLAGLSTDYTSETSHNDPFGVHYHHSADTWSIALMLWEMIFVVPFGSFLPTKIDYDTVPLYQQNMEMLELIATTISRAPPKEDVHFWNYVDPVGVVQDDLKNRWSTTEPKGLLAFAAKHRLTAKLSAPKIVGQVVDVIQRVLGEWDPRKRMSPRELYDYMHHIFPGERQVREYRSMRWVCPWTQTFGDPFYNWLHSTVKASMVKELFALSRDFVHNLISLYRPSAAKESWVDVTVGIVDLTLKATWVAQTKRKVYQTLNLLYASMCIVATRQRRYIGQSQVLHTIHRCEISKRMIESSHKYQVMVCQLMGGAMDTDNVYRRWRLEENPGPGEVMDGERAFLRYFQL